MSKKEKNNKCRLLIIGDSKVGKTSFSSMYSKGTFNINYLSTIGVELFSKDDIIDNETIHVELWDTAGSEKFNSLTAGFFGKAEGIMVMFDVTCQASFDNIRNWTESIKTHLSGDLNKNIVIIIGNKIDCVEREIKTNEAKNYCNELGFEYFETSAKTGQNVNSTIKYLVKQVIKNKNKNSVTGSYHSIDSIDGCNNNKIPFKQRKNEGCCCIVF